MTSLIALDTFLVRAIERRRTTPGASPTMKAVPAALDLARRCGATIVVKNFFAPAYHMPSDSIILPPRLFRFFRRRKLLASIILHELVHWSGAVPRLNRLHSERQFDDGYNREELVAEIGAVLLSHDLGISRRPILPNHQYLAHYLNTIDRPDVAMRVALGQAEQAAAYLKMAARSR